MIKNVKGQQTAYWNKTFWNGLYKKKHFEIFNENYLFTKYDTFIIDNYQIKIIKLQLENSSEKNY